MTTAITHCAKCGAEIRYKPGCAKPRICVMCDEPPDRERQFHKECTWELVAGPAETMEDFGHRLFQRQHVMHNSCQPYPEWHGCRFLDVKNGREVQL